MKEHTRVTLRNDIACLPDLDRAIASFGAKHGLAAEVLHDVRLALEEVVVNIIRHAYKDAGTHRITVRMVRGDGELVLEVTDDGRPFDPRTFPPPDLSPPLEKRPQGGLGVFLTLRLMDAVQYRREGKENVLTMRKALARGKA